MTDALAAWKERLEGAKKVANRMRDTVVFAVPEYIDAGELLASPAGAPRFAQTVRFDKDELTRGLDCALDYCSHCQGASEAERILSRHLSRHDTDKITPEKLAHLWLLYEMTRDRASPNSPAGQGTS